MRLYEFDQRQNKLMTLLLHLKRAAQDGGDQTIGIDSDGDMLTTSFLKRAANVGVSIDQAALQSLMNTNSAVGNLIASVDNQKISLNISDAEDDFMGDDFDIGPIDDEELSGEDELGMDDVEAEMPAPGAAPAQPPEMTVKTMARGALARRGK